MQINRRWGGVFGYSTALIVYSFVHSRNSSSNSSNQNKKPWYLKTLLDVNRIFSSNDSNSNNLTTDERWKLLSALWTLHFGRRLIETAFINEYKSSESLAETIITGVYYGFWALISSFDDSAKLNKNVATIGALAFIIGEVGNGYHHYLLKCFKNEGKSLNKRYIMPHGGLFDQVTAPHYFFELISWSGWSLLNSFTIGSIMILGGSWGILIARSKQVHERNIKTFDNYPTDRKKLVPFIW